MPGMDGLAVLRESRAQGITTPALFLTAKAEIEDRVTGLDAGADDVISNDDSFEIHTSPSEFSSVRKYLEDKGLNFFEAEVRMLPQNKITLEGEDLVKFNKLVDALEDLDDVQDVFHNVDLPDEDEEE